MVHVQQDSVICTHMLGVGAPASPYVVPSFDLEAVLRLPT